MLKVFLICVFFGLGMAGFCNVKPVPFPFTDGVEEIRKIRETLQDIATTLTNIGKLPCDQRKQTMSKQK